MKVDVLQVSEAKFRTRFSWWSLWIDIAVFDYECEPHLIQMKVSRTNSKKFKTMSTTGFLYRQAKVSEVGNLTQMNKQIS